MASAPIEAPGSLLTDGMIKTTPSPAPSRKLTFGNEIVESVGQGSELVPKFLSVKNVNVPIYGEEVIPVIDGNTHKAFMKFLWSPKGWGKISPIDPNDTMSYSSWLRSLRSCYWCNTNDIIPVAEKEVKAHCARILAIIDPRRIN